jgi:hypothetical protein
MSPYDIGHSVPVTEGLCELVLYVWGGEMDICFRLFPGEGEELSRHDAERDSDTLKKSEKNRR